MLLSRTIFTYLAINYLKILLGVVGLLSLCVVFINMLDIMSKFRSEIVPLTEIIYMALLKMPLFINELVPLSILLSSLYFFQVFSRRNELIILFTGGVSIFQILQPIIFITIMVNIVSITITQPISAICLQMYNKHNSNYNNRNGSSKISVADSGLYIFENLDNGNRIISARNILAHGNKIMGATILELDKRNNLISRIESDLIIFHEKKLILSPEAYRISSEGEKEQVGIHELETRLSFKTIIKRFESPENISFWKLSKLSYELSAAGINSEKFVTYYYKLLLRPLYGVTVIFIAASFFELNHRGKSYIKMLSKGAIIGFLIHGSKEIVVAVLASKGFSPFMAQFLPILIIGACAMLFLFREFKFLDCRILS
ncbi:MAG: LptF/LptG family permease [Rickettsiaceae bacterium]|nr:LptF/LptG family permease [Rickettsiaceae bacterium]